MQTSRLGRCFTQLFAGQATHETIEEDDLGKVEGMSALLETRLQGIRAASDRFTWEHANRATFQ